MARRGIHRAEQYAAGATIAGIAADEGVTYSTVRESIERVVSRAQQTARYGTVVPDGYSWYHRTAPGRLQGTWYVMGGPLTVQAVQWALGVVTSETGYCTHCGRAY